MQTSVQYSIETENQISPKLIIIYPIIAYEEKDPIDSIRRSNTNKDCMLNLIIEKHSYKETILRTICYHQID